jgi:hypothetical protein
VDEDHPLHHAVANAAKRYVKKHRTPLHELMDKFDLKPEKMERISAVRYSVDWESGMAVSIQSSKEEAEEEHNKDGAHWKVYSDGSGIEGKIGAAAVLFRDGVEVKSIRRRLGSARYHTVYEGKGVGGALAMALIWRERDVEGEVTIAVDSTAAIRATQKHQANPSHWI